MKPSRLVPALVAAAVGLTLGACGSSAGASNPLSDKGSGNGDSGTVTVYTSEPDTDFATLVKAFNKQYPHITVKTFRSGTEQIQSKLEAEQKTRSVQADVIFIADALTMENFKSLHLLAPYSPPASTKIDKQYVDPQGYYTGTKIISTGIVINTNKVKSPPTSWLALTEPQTNKQVELPSPLYSGAAAYNLVTMADDPSLGWQFWTKLAANGASLTQGNGAVIQDVATGTKAYGAVVDYLVGRDAKAGSPVKFIYPTEGVPAITEPIALAAGSHNVPLAKKFIDFVLSDTGQGVAASLGYVPIDPNAPVPNGLEGISQLKVIGGDLTTLTSQLPAAKARFSTLFHQ